MQKDSPAYFTGCVDTLLTTDKMASCLYSPINLSYGVAPHYNQNGSLSSSSSSRESLADSSSSRDSENRSVHSISPQPFLNRAIERPKYNPSRGIKRNFNGSSSSQGDSDHNESDSYPKRKQICRESFNSSSQDSLEHVPPQLLNDSKWDVLSQAVWDHFQKNRQTEEIYSRKMILRHALFNILRDSFPYCGLYVVGSSMNGLGTNSSDMDMCLVLSHQEIDQEKDATLILQFILNTISKCKFVTKPMLINAKVPILKFVDSVSGVEVDLNVNNAVGIRNTQLLNSYSRLDWRVRPLVLVAKSWAREHNINDAKNMTISSYSLVLMVIHYLQDGCNPPVLPCLQQLQPGHFQPNSDISKLVLLEKLPPFESKNSDSLGELFEGFLDYFAHIFDFRKDALSIRLGKTISKQAALNYRSIKNKRGMWKFLCIEEPFERSNTARSVYDEAAFKRILCEFRESWKILSTTKCLSSILESG